MGKRRWPFIGVLVTGVSALSLNERLLVTAVIDDTIIATFMARAFGNATVSPSYWPAIP